MNDDDLKLFGGRKSNRRVWLQHTVLGGAAAWGLGGCSSRSAEGDGEGDGSDGGSDAGASRSFVHPGLLHGEADFARMREQVAAGVEPWASAHAVLAASPQARLGRTPAPLVAVVRGGEGQNFGRMITEVASAYQLALRWQVTGDAAYAELAVRYVNAWVSTMTSLSGNADRFLAAGLYGYQWANAAEILRTYSGWRAADIAACQQWLLTHFYALNHQFLERHNDADITNYWANWDLISVIGMMSIGVFCDRADIYQEAVDYYRGGRGNGALHHMVYARHPGHLGQWQESHRDQGHATLGIGMAALICETAWHQGDDLYGLDDNRLLAGAEYVARSNLLDGNGALHELPFFTYVNKQGTGSGVSPAGRPHARPAWEAVYNHYVMRKGLAAPSVAAMAAQMRPEGASNGDDPGFGTLTFSRAAEVRLAVPSGVQAIVRGGAVQLTWWGTAEAAAHAVMRAPAGSAATDELTRVAAGQLTTWTDSTVQHGRWDYRVCALDSAGRVLCTSAVATVDLDAPLLLNLPLDDGQGAAARDVSGGHAAGTLQGGAGWAAGRSAGRQALSLDGASGHLALPEGLLAGVGDVTVSAWVYWNGTSGGNVRLFDIGSSDITYFALLLSRTSLRASITNTTWYGEQSVAAAAVATQRWTHVAVTLRDRTFTLYVDGVAVAAMDTVHLAPYQLGRTARNWLGRAQYAADPYFSGRLQDFRVHAGALAAADVLALARD